MKALTLHQPWASLVAEGVKTIETRSWSTKHRGRLAIHSSRTSVTNGVSGLWTALDGRPAPPGCVVAVCTLADVVPMVSESSCGNIPGQGPIIAIGGLHNQYVTGLTWKNTVSPTRYIDKEWTEGEIAANRPYGDFAPGRFAWLLRDIQRLDPVPARGRQQLWEWAS